MQGETPAESYADLASVLHMESTPSVSRMPQLEPSAAGTQPEEQQQQEEDHHHQQQQQEEDHHHQQQQQEEEREELLVTIDGAIGAKIIEHGAGAEIGVPGTIREEQTAEQLEAAEGMLATIDAEGISAAAAGGAPAAADVEAAPAAEPGAVAEAEAAAEVEGTAAPAPEEAPKDPEPEQKEEEGDARPVSAHSFVLRKLDPAELEAAKAGLEETPIPIPTEPMEQEPSVRPDRRQRDPFLGRPSDPLSIWLTPLS